MPLSRKYRSAALMRNISDNITLIWIIRGGGGKRGEERGRGEHDEGGVRGMNTERERESQCVWKGTRKMEKI